MSEETVPETPETPEAPQEPTGGKITIDVSGSSVKYDSELSLPEMLFWMDVVRNMAVRRVIGDS